VTVGWAVLHIPANKQTNADENITSLAEVKSTEAGADSSLSAVSLVKIPHGKLKLFSVRPVVICPATGRHRPLTSTELTIA